MKRRNRFPQPVDWHVYNRGSRRMALFRDRQDAEVFCSFLKAALEVSGCALWAFLLMSNHFHLALRGNSRQLQACMQNLQRLYSRYHNRRYGLSGAAFEGRYEAYPQGTLPMLLRVIAYIFMNPVAAGMVARADDYTWSNLAAYRGDRPILIGGDVDLLLSRIDEDPSVAVRRLGEFIEREELRIARGRHRPGLTARDIQANHFDWLLEEATRRATSAGDIDPLTLAVYWAKTAGFHRSAIAQAIGGTMSGELRDRLRNLRRRLKDDPSAAQLLQLP